jgi:hypothetical protein
MKSKALFVGLSLFMLIVLCRLFSIRASAQNLNGISGLTIDDNTVVRFLFRPPYANHILPALIFRVADEGSPNWNTAPIDQYGRSPYVSFSEMTSLGRKLENDHLKWQVSSSASSIEPFEKIAPSRNLFITIYSSNGMATSSLSPNEFCKILSDANETIESKRGHWEFEYFRRGCGCKVAGYKADAYPNNR